MTPDRFFFTISGMETGWDRKTLEDRFAGSAIGTFVGDALGMPVEGWSHAAIKNRLSLVREMLPGRFPPGFYTDDTEMMISILECLVERGGFDPAFTASRFLTNFHPERGYGGRIYGLMERLRNGEDWNNVGTDSFGNGSAMRIAPIGFFYFDSIEELKAAALLSSRITHTHSEALAGAVAQAGAVAKALALSIEGKSVRSDGFLEHIALLVEDLDHAFSQRLRSLKGLRPASREEFFYQVLTRFSCNVKSIEAVPPAIASFLFSSSFEEAVVNGVNLGGDTDTIGAMAGAVAGAYYGLKAIPERWLDVLENGAKGRDYVIHLAFEAARTKHEQRTGP